MLRTGKYATRPHANTQIRVHSFAQMAPESGFFGLGKQVAQFWLFFNTISGGENATKEGANRDTGRFSYLRVITGSVWSAADK
jgi:hypothetical protein